jgi:signal transduction histidine kinase
MDRRVRRQRAEANARKREVTLARLVKSRAMVARRGHLVEFERIGRNGSDAGPADDALDEIEAQYSAVLRALPDLVFVIQSDGTYLDYHAGDAKQLFAPPSAFIGRKIREIMPPSLADMFDEAITNAIGSSGPVVVKYELPMSGDRRSFEARLTAAGGDRVIAIVRDLTEIERAHAQNRSLAGRLIASQEMERRRIARELHDDLSQKVALLNIEIDQLVAPGVARRERVKCQKRLAVRLSELADDLNHLAHRLHPSKLHTLGLEASIRSICAEFSRRRDIKVSFTHGPLPRTINPNVSLCLYRVAQEGLHNVFRHSQASHVSVELCSEQSALLLQIVDDGLGFDPVGAERTGLGLVSMRERVSQLGGTLQIRSGAQTGSRITAMVPLREAVRHRSRDAATIHP